MVARVTKIAVLVVLIPLLVFTFAWWTDLRAGALAWPAVYLASLGLNYSLVAWAFMILAIILSIVWAGVRLRWPFALSIALAVAIGYCAGGWFFLRYAEVPAPAAAGIYGDLSEAASYRAGFALGYRKGLTGVSGTYCFAPPAETTGYYEGAYAARILWYRSIGRKVSEDSKWILRQSAGIDGVEVNLE
jgi:hypothetical protein